MREARRSGALQVWRERRLPDLPVGARLDALSVFAACSSSSVNRAIVGPARIRFSSPELGCEVRRGIGFRAACPCGFRGPVRKARLAALDDARGHSCPDPP
jgi:hypothetical protein